MNELNYTSLEASMKLKNAGILNRLPKFGDRVYSIKFRKEGIVIAPGPTCLEPGAFQASFDDGQIGYFYPDDLVILFSMAEVWRELPEKYNAGRKCLMMVEGLNIVGYSAGNGFDSSQNFSNTKPADALIDLLIWVKKEGVENDQRRT